MIKFEAKIISMDDFHDSTDYTNPEVSPKVYYGDTNEYLTYGKLYDTYAPNVIYNANGCGISGRLIYVLNEIFNGIENTYMIRIYFGVNDILFISPLEYRNTKLNEIFL